MIEWLWWLLPLLLVWLIGLLAANADWGGPHVNWLDGWTRILCRSLHGLGKQQIDLPENGQPSSSLIISPDWIRCC